MMTYLLSRSHYSQLSHDAQDQCPSNVSNYQRRLRIKIASVSGPQLVQIFSRTSSQSQIFGDPRPEIDSSITAVETNLPTMEKVRLITRHCIRFWATGRLHSLRE